MDKSKRGLDTFYAQPPQAYLEAHSRFSFKSGDLRITFHKRQRAGRKPTWNGVIHRKGKSYCAYAGTSETFEIAKVERKLAAVVSSHSSQS